MYRYFFRFVVATLTILTANLLTTAISNYMTTYRNHVKPLTFTLIAMAIIVVVFYPLFIKMEDWLKSLSVRFIRTGKSVGGKYVGLFITFLVALIVLMYFYAKMWYHIDLLKILFSGSIGKYM